MFSTTRATEGASFRQGITAATRGPDTSDTSDTSDTFPCVAA